MRRGGSWQFAVNQMATVLERRCRSVANCQLVLTEGIKINRAFLRLYQCAVVRKVERRKAKAGVGKPCSNAVKRATVPKALAAVGINRHRLRPCFAADNTAHHRPIGVATHSLIFTDVYLAKQPCKNKVLTLPQKFVRKGFSLPAAKQSAAELSYL